MSEPLQGQKTSIVAALFTLLQTLSLAGFIGPDVTEPASQIVAGLFAVTLALKARRAAKGS